MKTKKTKRMVKTKNRYIKSDEDEENEENDEDEENVYSDEDEENNNNNNRYLLHAISPRSTWPDIIVWLHIAETLLQNIVAKHCYRYRTLTKHHKKHRVVRRRAKLTGRCLNGKKVREVRRRFSRHFLACKFVLDTRING